MSGSAVHERRVALGVTTVGILAATLNASILLISLPAIFAGLGLDPLAPSNISLLLWMLMGYMLVTAVLVVTFGRLGDQYGRARLFNLGLRDLHRRLHRLRADPQHRHRRGLGTDRAAGGAGHRRRHADRQLDRDHRRRLPGRSSRFRLGRQPGRRRSPGRSSA